MAGEGWKEERGVEGGEGEATSSRRHWARFTLVLSDPEQFRPEGEVGHSAEEFAEVVEPARTRISKTRGRVSDAFRVEP